MEQSTPLTLIQQHQNVHLHPNQQSTGIINIAVSAVPTLTSRENFQRKSSNKIISTSPTPTPPPPPQQQQMPLSPSPTSSYHTTLSSITAHATQSPKTTTAGTHLLTTTTATTTTATIASAPPLIDIHLDKLLANHQPHRTNQLQTLVSTSTIGSPSVISNQWNCLLYNI